MRVGEFFVISMDKFLDKLSTLFLSFVGYYPVLQKMFGIMEGYHKLFGYYLRVLVVLNIIHSTEH